MTAHLVRSILFLARAALEDKTHNTPCFHRHFTPKKPIETLQRTNRPSNGSLIHYVNDLLPFSIFEQRPAIHPSNLHREQTTLSYQRSQHTYQTNQDHARLEHLHIFGTTPLHSLFCCDANYYRTSRSDYREVLEIRIDSHHDCSRSAYNIL